MPSAALAASLRGKEKLISCDGGEHARVEDYRQMATGPRSLHCVLCTQRRKGLWRLRWSYMMLGTRLSQQDTSDRKCSTHDPSAASVIISA